MNDSPAQGNDAHAAALNRTQTTRARGGLTDDSGFSLVEIVIAMLLFAVIAVGLLPLIFGVTQVTVQNSESVRGKAVIQQKLSQIQASYPTDPAVSVGSRPPGQTDDCVALLGLPDEVIEGGLTLSTTAGPCPAAGVYPGTVAVEITVTNGSGDTVASAYSSVRVTQ